MPYFYHVYQSTKRQWVLTWRDIPILTTELPVCGCTEPKAGLALSQFRDAVA